MSVGMGGAAALRLEPERTAAVVVVAMAAGFLILAFWRLLLIALSARPATPSPEPSGWPSYTVLAALYDEAEVVPLLIARLARLD